MLVIYLFCIFQLCIVLTVTTVPYPVIIRSKDEKKFFNPADGRYIPFPSINEPWSVNISIIVPAYEEEVRCKLKM